MKQQDSRQLLRTSLNWLWSFLGEQNESTKHNVLLTFPLYIPCGAGNYKDKTALTIQTINQIFPFLSSLSRSVNEKVLQVSSPSYS